MSSPSAAPVTPLVRVVPPTRPPGSPPAVWEAFVRQGRWKNGVLVAQFGVIFLLAVANVIALRRPPDVVLIGPDGKSQYLNRQLASESLQRFLDEQKQKPSDLTIGHFSRDFLQLALAVNATTIDAAWPDALSRATPELAEKLAKEATKEKLLETYKAAGTRTELGFDELTLLDHSDDYARLRARLTRRRTSLLQGADAKPLFDHLEVELLERVVPRSVSHPDGLVVADLKILPLGEAAPSNAGSASSPDGGAR